MNDIVIYISIIVIIITIIFIYIYYRQESNHQYQQAKIKALEDKYNLKMREIEDVSTKTIVCPVSDLTSPRSCYYGSNYRCSWNDIIGRCDLI